MRTPLTRTMPPHETVRRELLEMQRFGGASIKPLALYKIFNQVFAKDKLPKNKVRNLVDVYTALCNEFYIINHDRDNPLSRFYMTNERIAKYNFAQKSYYGNLKFLAKYGFVKIEKGRNPSKPVNEVNWITIDIDMLRELTLAAEELHQAEKIKKARWRAE